jgi:putative ABC transport system permease protein
VALGSIVTLVFSLVQGWPPTVPIWVAAGGIGSTVVIGGLAGWYPAARAAAVPPTSALASV